MLDAVICAPLRTPVGRFGGALKTVPAADLASAVIIEILSRTGLSGADIDDVILGQGAPNGEAPAIGRVAALDAGLGIGVPGRQVDRRCGSGLQAVLDACMQVSTGVSDVVLAGGVESMSSTEFYTDGVRWGVGADSVPLQDRLARARITAGGTHFPVPGGMIETAENLREQYGVPRADQDAFAVQSHQRAVAAQRSGVFAEEIVPVTVPRRRAIPSSSPTTSTHEPTPPSSRCPGSARSAGRSIRNRQSPPATPAVRTTAPRSASSPRRTGPQRWG